MFSQISVFLYVSERVDSTRMEKGTETKSQRSSDDHNPNPGTSFSSTFLTQGNELSQRNLRCTFVAHLRYSLGKQTLPQCETVIPYKVRLCVPRDEGWVLLHAADVVIKR